MCVCVCIIKNIREVFTISPTDYSHKLKLNENILITKSWLLIFVTFLQHNPQRHTTHSDMCDQI